MIRSLNTTVKFAVLLVLIVAGALLWYAAFGPGTAAGATTFTVNSTLDDGDANFGDGTCATAGGDCTLRAAIQESNNFAGTDTIEFNIPGTGPHTISPASVLPSITEPVTIDGYTQPGASANTNGPGLATNAVLMIELEGSSAGAGVNGLTITAGSSTVKGLVINRFIRTAGSLGSAIWLETAGGNTIEGNYIGTDVTGTADLGNGGAGVLIINAPNNTIGGTAAAARNIISGNRWGVFMLGAAATGNVVLGNYIDTDVTGTAALGDSSQEEVLIQNAPNNTIGGTSAGARNVILGTVTIIFSGATGNVVLGNYIGTDVTGTVDLANDLTLGQRGVRITRGASGNTIGGLTAGARNIISGRGGKIVFTGASNNVVQGNYIGTDVTGTVSLGGSGGGVRLNESDNNTIGGTTAGARNIISGNAAGVLISNGSTGNLVQGNYIGTDVTGTVALSNRGLGGVRIRDGATNNTIGGTASGAGNIIAFNSKGVNVIGDTTTGNAILSNSIFSNGFPIDLANDGVTLNDAGDGDIGPNNLQNYPVLTSAESGSTNIEGSLNSAANTEFRVEFFANTACDFSGNGEGETFLGFDTVTTDGVGDVSFSVSFPATVAVGDFITATATDPDGNTSEFSECVEVLAASSPTPTPTPTSTPTPTPTPTPTVSDLGDTIVALGLPNGLENSLTAKVNAAQKLADRGNPCAAANVLEAFINQVEANPGGAISEGDAADLIALAKFLIAGLNANSCPPDPDADGDGLGNSAELTLATDPANADTDGDGCTDLREFGSTAEAGGQRDPNNAWDFYDVNGDGVIDLPNDILGVIQHYAPTGTEPEYDVDFDRGPSAGPNAWNMTSPDGVIDLPNDILGVIRQFGHNCQ